jgi:hypothetical protein
MRPSHINAMTGALPCLPAECARYAHRMSTGHIRVCDECSSAFLVERSSMSALCSECAHWLYGHPTCQHVFKDGRCTHCHWDGSVSPYVRRLQSQAQGANTGNEEA